MNKKLLVLICSIILFQYVYNEDNVVNCTNVESPTEDGNCVGKPTSLPTKKCEFDSDANPKKCKEVDIPCSEKISGASESICLKLVASEGKKCTVEGEKCVEKIKKIKKNSSTNNLKFSLAFLIVLFLF